MGKRIKIYIIARISEEVHGWTDTVCSQLDERFEVFAPKDHNPWNERHETFSKEVFDCDLDAIKSSDMGLMLPEYGNDCAWEAGYYSNSSKPAVIFVDTQMEWLRDWMVKGGVDYVITCNPSTYAILNSDAILKHKKIILISKIEEISDTLATIYESYPNKSS